MEQDKENSLDELGKMALLSDYLVDLFPEGDTIVVFELNKEDYGKMIGKFREIDRHHNQFTVEISGVDFHFMLTEDK
jgi:hypothetical protein